MTFFLKLRLKFPKRRHFKTEETEPTAKRNQRTYYENPYLSQLREITEQILEKRQIKYASFAPVLIDGNTEEIREKVLSAAEDLSADLNYLTILTDEPAYFQAFAEKLFEEQGLIVQIFEKNQINEKDLTNKKIYGNVLLDFERENEFITQSSFAEKIYIPIFKKAWESGGNLDIEVPIGYNTMIVRDSKKRQKRSECDRFERGFYDNE